MLLVQKEFCKKALHKKYFGQQAFAQRHKTKKSTQRSLRKKIPMQKKALFQKYLCNKCILLSKWQGIQEFHIMTILKFCVEKSVKNLYYSPKDEPAVCCKVNL